MRNTVFLSFFLIITLGMGNFTHAQNEPVLYFCEHYDNDNGEIGISDRFTTGSLTIIVRCDYELGLRNVYIQYDRYDISAKRFRFYKKFNFTIEPDMKYVDFSQTKKNDMSFDETGFYRVYLLNQKDEIIASSIVEIVE